MNSLPPRIVERLTQSPFRGNLGSEMKTLGILDRMRARLPRVRSILMDRDTLITHRTQFVVEPTPTVATLAHLTDAERSLYRDLVEDRYGPSIRLEQERIRFSLVRRALAPWLPRTTPDS